MFETPLNLKTVTVKIKRIELCDLLLACSAISASAKDAGETGKKWDELHDKLKAILDDFDQKQKA